MLGTVIGALAFNYDLTEVLSDLHALSFWTIAIIFVALLTNALAATVRFKTIAGDIGHSIDFRQAMATVSTGTLAGAMFFQIAGQLIARGAMMGRAGIPFANVVVITAYERVISAIISGLLGLAGAYYIFGVVYLDKDAGGAVLLKILVGLIAATSLGALFGYGRLAAQSITPLLTRNVTYRLLRVVGLTLLVQLPTMVAYVTAAKALSVDTAMPSLIAASTVVMFAASVPISLAGWGVREMSAVAALGAIGVAGHAAFTTALLVGIGSLLAMGLVAMLSVSSAAAARPNVTQTAVPPIDYTRALSWFLPLAVATLVLFQIHVPIGSGLLNVNLADPIAVLGGAIFVLKAVKQRQAPAWRTPNVNFALAVATLFLIGALLIGEWRFGWMIWAWVNRFLGWFVLLSYGATAALVVMEEGKAALPVVLLTFVGAITAVCAIDIGIVFLREAGFQTIGRLVPDVQIEGFAQNRNSFALQLLMAAAASLAFVRGIYVRRAVIAIVFAALWLAGSRSGWIALVCLSGTAIYLRATRLREVVTAAFCAMGIVLITISPGVLPSFADFHHDGTTSASLFGQLQFNLGAVVKALSRSSSLPPVTLYEPATQERLVSIVGGLRLFAGHPVFGAGLGAFVNEGIPASYGSALVIHSTPVWLLAELGIVGLLAFAIPAWRVFVTEWKYAPADQASAVIVLCFVAMAVMSAPADMLYQRTFWFVVGAALALRREQPIIAPNSSQ